MNLFRTQRALLAIERAESRALRISRARNEADLREMSEEGLIEAHFSDGSPGSVMSTATLTDAGRHFLRVFPSGYRLCDAGLLAAR